MIEIENTILFFKYKRIWFANRVPKFSPFTFVSLRQFIGEQPKNYSQKKFITLHSDLTKSEDELLKLIAKNTKYEIKRADRETVVDDIISIEEFSKFYNDFAPIKNLPLLTDKNINALKPHSIATYAKSENSNALAMHLYLIDKEVSRVRLLYSATVNREKTNLDLNFIARANRFLHWQDMLRFKKSGIKIYDWGGIAGDADNPASLAEKIKVCVLDNDYYKSVKKTCIKRRTFFEFDWVAEWEKVLRLNL